LSDMPLSQDMKARILRRFEGSAPQHELADWRLLGVDSELSRRLQPHFPRDPVPAAVLVPLVDHPRGLTILLTQRATHLANHSGQISFPGGRLEPTDPDVASAALREAQEEIGLGREHVEVLGCLPDHAVITGFRVTPVVGLVHPGFELVLDPTEVAGSFEAPLRHLLDPSTHARRQRRIAGEDVETFELPWGSFNIWGATAGMLLTLRETLGVPPADGD
jgi:8-oxo-dGTP pyrophosphatase MutT (NUDIX family)